MAHSRLGIRPYVPADLDEVRLAISRSIVEPLAVANNRSAYPEVVSTSEILTVVLSRLLSPVHGCNMGCVVVRVG